MKNGRNRLYIKQHGVNDTIIKRNENAWRARKSKSEEH